MIFQLPDFKKKATTILYSKFSSSNSSISKTEKLYSWITCALASICIVIIMNLTSETTKGFISPIITSLTALNPLTKHPIKINQTFRFIPSWNLQKLADADFEKAQTLAFFDIPVDSDGTFIRDNNGYESFVSEEAQILFQKAYEQGSKVVLTISQTDNQDIRTILYDTQARQTIINETIQEVEEAGIDGVAVDFEYNGDVNPFYKEQFTKFISEFSRTMHKELPNSQVNVVVPNNAGTTSLYDLKNLSEASDRIYIMAYDFAVPETKKLSPIAPVYGYDKEDYWNKVDASIAEFANSVSEEKLVLETAWYENGNNYPLYTSNRVDTTPSKNTLSLPLDRYTAENLIAEVPRNARSAARKNLPLIAKALEKENILNSNVLAYALATIEHETAATFEPIDEIKGRKSARRLGYEGGTNYYGRGFIQLTHLRNYKKIGARIGVGDQLVKNPDMASEPEISAQILAAFFKDNGIARLASEGRFVAARRPINPDYQGYWIAELAYKYLYMLG